MTVPIVRHQAGTPAGGRFAPTGRPEGDVDELNDRGTIDGADIGGRMPWKRTSDPIPNIKLSSTASTLREFMDAMRDEFDLNASYQRGSVWDVERRRALVESVLTGLPIGAIWIAKQDWKTDGPAYRVVDGKQRMEALQAFRDGDFGVPADWFNDEELDVDKIDEDGLVRFDHGLTRFGRNRIFSSTIAKVEFDSHVEWVRTEPGKGTSGSDMGWTTRQRSPQEAEAFEAMVYGRCNTGGVDQTEADLANAARIAAGAA